MITGANHTSFTVSDMERSLAFYRDLLGLEVLFDQEGTGGYLAAITGFPDAHLRIVHLRIPGSTHRLELVQYYRPQGQPADVRTCNPGSAHLCFEVADLEAAYQRLRAAGVRFRSEPTPITAGANKGGAALYLLDPDGITLELFQPPPRV
jgi:catechol 2,3-dioxygenase-like lactoylglutathione lyase family enzyme